MRSAREAIDRLRDPAAGVSAHYLVDEDGAILRMVPEERRAWHAGASYWRGNAELNGRSIGVEMVNPGHAWGYLDFPVLQLAAVCDLCLAILERHPIPQRNVVAHSDVAPDRKEDPGEKFDWWSLAGNGVGLWPDGVPDLGIGGALRDAADLHDVRAALSEIGYRVALEGGHDRGAGDCAAGVPTSLAPGSHHRRGRRGHTRAAGRIAATTGYRLTAVNTHRRSP